MASWGKAGGGAAKGAAAGALIGSAVPGIGTAAGAIGGGVLGGAWGAMQSSKAEDDLRSELQGVQKPDMLKYDPLLWEKMKQQQTMQSGQLANQSYGSQAQAAGDIWSRLAQGRGLSTGAAERGARDAALGGMVARQDIGKQSLINNLGLDIQGLQQKQAIDAQNQQIAYNEWANVKKALAELDANKGGGFLGLLG